MAELKPVVITFGAGLNTRSRLADVKVTETTAGENFDLDVSNASLRPRRPFKKITTTTNSGSINGFAQLIARDGTITTLIQSASVVYSWDGVETFATQAEVDPSSKLRGHRDHLFGLATQVIITDLAKIEDLAAWNGSTYGTLSTGLTNLKAKYCTVVRERVVLSNIKENAVDLPHMTVMSKVSTATTFSVTDKPSSALGLDDPVYIISPDLRPINGMQFVFGEVLYSTERGRMFILSGSSSFNFSIGEFYPSSNASGDESMINIGNDVMFGRRGALELLESTLKFGDVTADDASRWISKDLEKVESWTLVYDQRGQKVLCFPNNQSAVYVFHKDLYYKAKTTSGQSREQESPWSRWTTTHDTNMTPVTVWSMVDPVTGIEAVYFGDSTGGIYQFDTDDEDQDGGSDVVTVTRRSGLVILPGVNNMFNIECWIDYTKQWPATVTLNFIFGGEQSPTQTITINVPGSTSIGNYYNSGSLAAYYGGEYYYNAGYDNTIRRQNFKIAGHGNFFQLEIVTSSAGRDWQIEEIGIEIQAA